MINNYKEHKVQENGINSELATQRAGYEILNQIADLYFIQDDLEKFQYCMEKAEADLRAFDADEA